MAKYERIKTNGKANGEYGSTELEMTHEHSAPTSLSEVGSPDESFLAHMRHACMRRLPMSVILEKAKEDAEDDGPKLSLFDLLSIGIGCTVGSGIFVLTSSVLPYSGPSSAISWVAAGCACLLSAYSYMELTSCIPTKGSTYVFAYHCLGEFPAVMAAVCLTLEYGVSGAGVAQGWSTKLAALIGPTYYPFPTQESPDGPQFDVMAAILQFLCVLVVLGGLRLVKIVTNVFTVVKVLLVIFMIIAGFMCYTTNIFESYDTFFPEGVGGTVTGTSLLFFGFIGFDEICCMAARSTDPRHHMPRAIAGTLLGTALLSMFAQVALCVMIPKDESGSVGDSMASEYSFENVFKDKGWQAARYVTVIGEIVLLPLVVLLSFFPQPELFAALAEDGLMPAMFHKSSGNGVFPISCMISGAIMIVFALFVPFVLIWDVLSLGVLIGFNLTNSSLIMLRAERGQHRSKIAKQLMIFWCTGALGAYLIWTSFARPFCSDDGLCKAATGVTGVIAFLFSFGLLWNMAYLLSHQTETQPESETVFFAPMVPFTPGFAILINFLLMSQFGLESHVCLFVLFALGFVMYVAQQKAIVSRHIK